MEKKQETKTTTKIPIDAGVDKKWLEAILKGDVAKPKGWTDKEIREMVATIEDTGDHPRNLLELNRTRKRHQDAGGWNGYRLSC